MSNLVVREFCENCDGKLYSRLSQKFIGKTAVFDSYEGANRYGERLLRQAENEGIGNAVGFEVVSAEKVISEMVGYDPSDLEF